MTVSSFGVVIIATLIRPFIQDATGFMQNIVIIKHITSKSRKRLPHLTLRGAYWPPPVHGMTNDYDLSKSRSQKTVHEVGVAAVHIKMISITLDLTGL